jgi:hypothetical protein
VGLDAFEVALGTTGDEFLDRLCKGVLGSRKVTLHINDHERRCRRIEFDRRLVLDTKQLLDFRVVVHGVVPLYAVYALPALVRNYHREMATAQHPNFL